MQKIKQQLKTKKFDNAYFFYGEEAYLQNFYLNSLKESVISEEFADLNYVVLEANELDRLQEAVENSPVISEKKIVVVKGAEISAQVKEAGFKLIEGVLDNISDFTILVFYAESIDKRTKLYKLFQKKCTVCYFGYQKPVYVINWIGNLFKKNGFSISRDTAIYLFEHTGVDMTNIKNEIDKLIAYCMGEGEIKKEDIDNITTKTSDIKTFDMLDAAVEKDAQLAFDMLMDMETHKEQPVIISGALAKHISNLLCYKILSAEGFGIEEISKRMNFAPFIVKKYGKQAKNLSINKLKKLTLDIAKFDIGMKTGEIEGYTGLYTLIAQLVEN